MNQTFVTYYEPIDGFKRTRQERILKCSIRSWQHFGFDTKVLSQADAEDHSLYKDLIFAVNKHTKINKTPWKESIRLHSAASFIRWLAFSRSNCSNFFLGDYDIFNLSVRPWELSYPNLTFLDHACLCFSYAVEPVWCENFIEIFIKNIDIMEEWNKAHGYYHDQDFVVQLLNKNPEVLQQIGIGLERKYVKSTKDGHIPPDWKFLHISHNSCNNNEKIRVTMSESVLSHIGIPTQIMHV